MIWEKIVWEKNYVGDNWEIKKGKYERQLDVCKLRATSSECCHKLTLVENI